MGHAEILSVATEQKRDDTVLLVAKPVFAATR